MQLLAPQKSCWAVSTHLLLLAVKVMTKAVWSSRPIGTGQLEE